MKKSIIFLILYLIASLFITIKTVSAATFNFDPETVNTPAGDTFEVKVNVDNDSEEIKGAEAFITFDNSLLEVKSIENGNLFKEFEKQTAKGKIYLAGLATTLDEVATAPGTLALITFKGITDGTTTLEFFCGTGNQDGSSIIKNSEENTNIIECSSNGTAVVTVGTGVNTSLSPTEPVSTPYPTPAVLPKTGIFDNVVRFAVPGAILLFIGTVVKLLL